MTVPFVDLGAQYKSIGAEIDRAVLNILATGHFILGEEVERFEKEFAAYCGVEHAIGVDSVTSALELALYALDVGPGDEVITPAHTFIATVLAILITGAKPVLVDIDAATYNIAPDAIEAAITPRTRVIMPVHLCGQMADMDPIRQIAAQHGLAIVEDACQAHGARYKGQRAGSLGDVAAFSFYPSKNLGGCGDGGIIVTNSQQIADRVRMLRNYGQQEKYIHVVKGYNRRLDTIQAAALRVKLPYLDGWNAARRAHAQQYQQLLAESGVLLPVEADYAEHIYHLYAIRTPQRDALRDHLQRQGVATGIHYPVPNHLQEACKDLGYKQGQFPVTEQCATEVLSLPMYAELETAQIREVAERTLEFTTHEARRS